MNAVLCSSISFLVELLAYKVEQEKCIASDLQKTLSEEQEKASDVRQLLLVEENTVRALKSELCECKQDNERLLESLSDVQREVLQLRYGCAPVSVAQVLAETSCSHGFPVAWSPGAEDEGGGRVLRAGPRRT